MCFPLTTNPRQPEPAISEASDAMNETEKNPAAAGDRSATSGAQAPRLQVPLPAPEAKDDHAPLQPSSREACVEQASWESFPASDAPGWTGMTAG